MKRFLALWSVLFIVLAFPVSVHADENSAWIELLEFSTVNNSGSNLFKITTTGTISIDTPQYMRCTKVDMLISHPVGYAPTSVKLRYSGSLYTLTMQTIDSTTVRVYGANIPDTLYANLVFQFNKSGSTAVQYQVLSCRVTTLASQEFIADAEVLVDGTYYPQAETITRPGVEAGTGSGISDEQIIIAVYDWMKYDSLTIWGSTVNLPLTSIRVTLGTAGLPFTVSYMDNTVAGYWTEVDEFESGSIDGDIYSGQDWSTGSMELMPEGKWLYCITIDLSSVDRTQDHILTVVLTGLYDDVWGWSFTPQYINGSVVVADTTNASWWSRFTAFMSGLFGVEDPAADEYGSVMESQAGAMQDAVDEMNQVTKPNVEQLDFSLDEYMSDDSMASVNGVLSSIFANDFVVTMLIIVLTCAFASYALFGKK